MYRTPSLKSTWAGPCYSAQRCRTFRSWMMQAHDYLMPSPPEKRTTAKGPAETMQGGARVLVLLWVRRVSGAGRKRSTKCCEVPDYKQCTRSNARRYLYRCMSTYYIGRSVPKKFYSSQKDFQDVRMTGVELGQMIKSWQWPLPLDRPRGMASRRVVHPNSTPEYMYLDYTFRLLEYNDQYASHHTHPLSYTYRGIVKPWAPQ